MKKGMALLLAVVLTAAGVSGCVQKETGPATSYFMNSRGNSNGYYTLSYPIANEVSGGTLLRAGKALYRWDGDKVEEVTADAGGLNSLLEVDGKLYYWEPGGICRYDWKTGKSTRLFTIGGEKAIDRFWASNGVLYAAASNDISDAGWKDDYSLYRYDIRAEKGETVDWLADLGGHPIVYAVVGDEILIYPLGNLPADGSVFVWMDTTDGSTRPCTLRRFPSGYRDGSLIVYQAGWEEIILHDVETCEETSIPVPRRILAAEDPSEYALLAVGEDSIYWVRSERVHRPWRETYQWLMEDRYFTSDTNRYTFYRQQREELETVFSYRTDAFLSDTMAYNQLIGDTFYFSYIGTPLTVLDTVDLWAPEKEPEWGWDEMVFCAVTADGTVYELVRQDYQYPNA